MRAYAKVNIFLLQIKKYLEIMMTVLRYHNSALHIILILLIPTFHMGLRGKTSTQLEYAKNFKLYFSKEIKSSIRSWKTTQNNSEIPSNTSPKNILDEGIRFQHLHCAQVTTHRLLDEELIIRELSQQNLQDEEALLQCLQDKDVSSVSWHSSRVPLKRIHKSTLRGGSSCCSRPAVGLADAQDVPADHDNEQLTYLTRIAEFLVTFARHRKVGFMGICINNTQG